MRRICLLLLVLALTLISPAVASAHGSGLAAILNIDPKNLIPGQPAKITVALFDAYNSPIAGMKVRIRIEQDDPSQPQQEPVDLHEAAPGSYTGSITLRADGFVVLRVDATLPDGLWSGPFPVEPGPGGTAVWDMGIQLLHQDALSAAPVPAPARPALLTPVVVVAALGAAVIWFVRRRR